MQIETKFRTGRYLRPVTLVYKDDRIYVKFGFNRTLINEIKNMRGAKWHGFDNPPMKVWSVDNCPRNAFQIKYLEGKNPYAEYEKELIEYTPTRPLMSHQVMQVRFVLTYRHCIIAAEMGTGKTLSAITVMEEECGTDGNSAWYVGPKSGVKAVTLELMKWDSKIRPRMMTYNGLVKESKLWRPGKSLPKVVIFDESSKLKTPSTGRSQAGMWLADAIREIHERNGIIMEMSGTPAPKSPVDWYHQAEIACPGFLAEGDIHKFKKRLCLVEQRESLISGGTYPHIVTWYDDSNKCKKCGELQDHENHTPFAIATGEGHEWEESFNEIEYLSKRLTGLVLVQFSKDYIDLPEIRKEEIVVKPTVEMLHAAKLITKTARRAVEALTLLREISDGFQYKEIEVDRVECPNCHGVGEVIAKRLKDESKIDGPNTDLDVDDYVDMKVLCDNCGGSGTVPKMAQTTEATSSPKDEYLIEELQNHEEVGRFIVWGGFTGTIDRLTLIARKQGWTVLQVDGRGYNGFNPEGERVNSDELLIAMDRTHPRFNELMEKYPFVVFVGQPESGGMALNLNASPTSLFYSNSFNGEARMQAIKRGHRMGMDKVRGHVIKDMIMLPCDRHVINNLDNKVKLQNMSMGELLDTFNEREV